MALVCIELVDDPVTRVGKIVKEDSVRRWVGRAFAKSAPRPSAPLSKESQLLWIALSCELLHMDCAEARFRSWWDMGLFLRPSWASDLPRPMPMSSSTTCTDRWCKTGTIGIRLLVLCHCWDVTRWEARLLRRLDDGDWPAASFVGEDDWTWLVRIKNKQLVAIMNMHYDRSRGHD